MPSSTTSSSTRSSRPIKKKTGIPVRKGSGGVATKKHAPRNHSPTKQGSTSTNKKKRTHLSSDWVPPSKTLLLIWLLVSGELALDLFSTVVAFIAMLEDFNCCGETIELGGLPLGVTLPFFFLVMVELVMLLLNIKRNITRTRAEAEEEEALKKSDTSWHAFLGVTRNEKIINGLLILNPFFGFMVAWLLLYQSNKKECFIVLGFEAASLILHWLSVYFEGNKQTRCSMAFHLIPLIPFLITVIVITVSINQGGVCYLVEEEIFWYKGCLKCPGGTPVEEDGKCYKDAEPYRGTYCGQDTAFCFFKY